MIIPAEEISQQKQQNFEQLCERIKNLDIQQSNVNHSSEIPPITSFLPSINELIDYQLLIRRVKELETNVDSQKREIEDLRKENSELNEKLSLLHQNIQLETKFNYLKQEFNNYKEEINEKFSNYSNDMNDFIIPNNHHRYEDEMIFDDISNPLKSNSQGQPYIYSSEPNDLINLQRDSFIVNNNNNNFENIQRELRDTKNEFNNDRDSLIERMNSLRNNIYNL